MRHWVVVLMIAVKLLKILMEKCLFPHGEHYFSGSFISHSIVLVSGNDVQY